MSEGRTKSEEARSRAGELFAKAKQKESDFIRERKREQAANAEKTTRLRGLRLAKEAADREAAAKYAAEHPAPPKKIRAPRVKPAPQPMPRDSDQDP